MKKLLALSCGGDRGCILLGMVYALFKDNNTNIEWSQVSGISAGSLVGSLVSQTDKNNFEEIMTEAKDIFTNGGFHVIEPWIWGGRLANIIDAVIWRESIYQNIAMKNLIRKHYNDSSLKRVFTVGAYNKTQYKYETFDSRSTQMATPILASASVPIIFPSVKINANLYEDGGMAYTVPINEIKKFISENSGPVWIDILFCFPINDVETFMKMTTSNTSYLMLKRASEIMATVMLKQMEHDLREIANLLNITYEKITKDNSSIFKNGDLTCRILSPKGGEYSSFIDMHPEECLKMYNSGLNAVEQLSSNKKINF
jgi:predicted acylesterase/phospholipase RssA